MTWWRSTTTAILLLALGVVAAPGALLAQTPTPKYGGVLTLMQREELPQGFAIHETSTIATVWPATPCYSNLVIFDPAKRMERPTPSWASWPRSGPGRTTTATWCSSSGGTSSGTTASRSPRRT